MKMTETILEAGVYELQQDVENPLVDRRCKREWSRQPTFKAGTRFQVFKGEHSLAPGHFYNEIKPLTKGLHTRINSNGSGEQIFAVLVPQLKTVENETVRMAFADQVVSASEVLAFLVESGELKIAQIKNAVSVMAEWDYESEEYQSLLKKHDLQ